MKILQKKIVLAFGFVFCCLECVWGMESIRKEKKFTLTVKKSFLLDNCEEALIIKSREDKTINDFRFVFYYKGFVISYWREHITKNNFIKSTVNLYEVSIMPLCNEDEQRYIKSNVDFLLQELLVKSEIKKFLENNTKQVSITIKPNIVEIENAIKIIPGNIITVLIEE